MDGDAEGRAGDVDGLVERARAAWEQAGHDQGGPGRAGPDELGLHEAEDRLQAAVRANDATALGLVLHDDLVARAPDGELVGKPEDLAAYAAGTSRVESYQELSRSVVVRFGTGVTLVRARVVGVYAGEPLDVVLDYARTWVHEDGRWQVLGAQIA